MLKSLVSERNSSCLFAEVFKIILGSIHNGAGPIVEWFCLFSLSRLTYISTHINKHMLSGPGADITAELTRNTGHAPLKEYTGSAP